MTDQPTTRPIPFLADLHRAILTWYAASGRTLPFRGVTDPYAILVSEAMAQQTQVTRAGEAWTRFMVRFPTVDVLAAAAPADVLRAWQGLGYNRRALNLWRSANVIVEQHGGRVPSDVAALEALPGVGPYTARAVAALAFGLPVGAVDTNVRRVLGRILAGGVGVLGTAEMQVVADAAVPSDRPGDWTHALMDLGATLCAPRRPTCEACPAQGWCRYVTSPSEPRPMVPRPTRAAAWEPAAPYATTSRWLRGRIVDRLRTAPDAGWTAVEAPMGGHGAAAVETALAALAREGLIQLSEADGIRPRLARLARRPR